MKSLKLKWVAMVCTAVMANFFAVDAMVQEKAEAVKSAEQLNAESYDKALKLYEDGHWSEAYTAFKAVALDPNCNSVIVFSRLVSCANRAQKMEELYDLLAQLQDVHAKNANMLLTLAGVYSNLESHGYIYKDKFYIGYNYRLQGVVSSNVALRNQQIAAKLFVQAEKIMLADKNISNEAKSTFYVKYSEIWRDYTTLLDLEKISEPQKQYPNYAADNFQIGNDNRPIYYKLPKDISSAKNNGERWLWCITEAEKYASKEQKNKVLFDKAMKIGDMLEGTYQRLKWSANIENSMIKNLADDEFIAIDNQNKPFVFKVPKEYNPIKILQEVAAGDNDFKVNLQLATIFVNRGQYVKAVEQWNKAKTKGGDSKVLDEKINHIVGNWAYIQPAHNKTEDATTIQIEFRNATSVDFKIKEVDSDKLLALYKAFYGMNGTAENFLNELLKTNKFKDNRYSYKDLLESALQNGYDDVLSKKVINFQEKLTPNKDYDPTIANIKLPLKSGLWWIEMKANDGNVSHMLLPIDKVKLVNYNCLINADKNDVNAQYYVADAKTGSPVANKKVYVGTYYDIYGNNKPTRVKEIYETTTDKNGFVTLKNNQPKSGNYNNLNNYFSFIMVELEDGKVQINPLNNNQGYYSRNENYKYAFGSVLFDRPVYRPGQKIHAANYLFNRKTIVDLELLNNNAKNIMIIRNPRGEEVYKKELSLDNYGRLTFDWDIPEDALLGQYSVSFESSNHACHTYASFGVEEYKKPEFEVKVEAPSETQVLGDKVKVKVKADYYFGAPVKEGKVEITVKRSEVNPTWFPIGRWDWLYGNGYGNLSLARNWYYEQNSKMIYPWRPYNHNEELIFTKEYELDEKGFVEVEIDTAKAKKDHGNQPQRYSVTASVMDNSRRTISGTGSILVADVPFAVHTWLDRGFYNVGETINASCQIRKIDGSAWQYAKDKPAQLELKLYKITYANNKAVETLVQGTTLNASSDKDELAYKINAGEVGQYRLVVKATVDNKNSETSTLFDIRGNKDLQKDFRYSKLELLLNKSEYAVGEDVKIVVNSEVKDAYVLLFTREINSAIIAPDLIKLENGTTELEVRVREADMPNFFITAMIVENGNIHTQTKQVFVPPQKKLLTMEVTPAKPRYQPGECVKTKMKLLDADGKPIVGSVVVTVYDKSLDALGYTSTFDQKWSKILYGNIRYNLFNLRMSDRFSRSLSYVNIYNVHLLQWSRDYSCNIYNCDSNDDCDESAPEMIEAEVGSFGGRKLVRNMAVKKSKDSLAPAANNKRALAKGLRCEAADMVITQESASAEKPAISVRSNFADMLYWSATLETDSNGEVEIEFPMCDSLTTWRILAKAITKDAKVGEASAEVISSKDFLVRLQTPRFICEGDTAIFSANIHNYLPTEEETTITLEIEGRAVELQDKAQVVAKIAAGGEKRIDWRVQGVRDGEVKIRIKAIAKNGGDAMEVDLPVTVWGMDKMETFNNVIQSKDKSCKIDFSIPYDRRPERTRLTIQCSPSLAGSMLDSLPFLITYPHGCTEQTLNRFLPALIARKSLNKLGVDLKQIEQRLNSGNSVLFANVEKAYLPKGGVFDAAYLDKCVTDGLARLLKMQCSDGGWGWFSGNGEYSSPHTTAWVVRGLLLARQNGATVDANALNRGISWLQNYQSKELAKLKLATELKDKKIKEVPKGQQAKSIADQLDVLVYSVLVDAQKNNAQMTDYIYRDRNYLSQYGLALFAIGLHVENHTDKFTMVMRNLEQFLVQDSENQTAYLDNRRQNFRWWYWYGDDVETQAMYLKLLVKTEPTSEKTAGVVKYLFNNRKNGKYWKSTRDTALVIEACCEYLTKNSETETNMQVTLKVDGKEVKTFAINGSNYLSAEHSFELVGSQLKGGKHQVEVIRQGQGRLYVNTMVSNFTMEDRIYAAGLELKIARRYYRIEKTTEKKQGLGRNNQELNEVTQVENRILLKENDKINPGDIIEVELDIDSKNDYEYILIQDPKPAGCETVEVRSGYQYANGLSVYSEYRDQRTNHYATNINRGKYLLKYRLRAETPGTFNVLPTIIGSMYATDLKGNSQSDRININK